MKDEIKEILDYISSRTVDDILLPDYFEKIEDYITNLQDEIQNLRGSLQTYEILLKTNVEEKDKEIERLNNIIDKLEKYLLELRLTDVSGKTIVYRLLDKLKALKEGK